MDFLIHDVYGGFLQVLPSLALAYLISWGIFKPVFKNRDVNPPIPRGSAPGFPFRKA